MLTLSEKQLEALAVPARTRLSGRIRAHWSERLPRLVACFSEEELALIVGRVIDLALADGARASEADVALSADLWLHELAGRRKFKRP